MKRLSLAIILVLSTHNAYASSNELTHLSPATSLDSAIGAIALKQYESVVFADGSSVSITSQGRKNFETLYTLQGMNEVGEVIQDAICHGQATHLVIDEGLTFRSGPDTPDIYIFSFLHSETPLGPEDLFMPRYCANYVFQAGEPTLTEEQRNRLLIFKKIEEISPTTITDSDVDPVPLMEQMKKRVDDFKGIAFYHHPLAHNTLLRPSISAYIGEKDDVIWGRMKLNYFADDWLFIHSVSLNADGQVFEFATEQDWEREVWEGGSISESNDSSLNDTNLEALSALAFSKHAVIRFYGKHYVDDMIVNDKDRQIIRDMLELKTELTAQKMQ